MDNRGIGIFDSGVGGLTVVTEVMKALPNENIIYFGDTARVPYGSKSKETVTELAGRMVRFLLAKDVKAIVIACGTVSTNSYDVLTAEFDIPLIDMLTSGVKAATEATRNNKVGVIATEAAINSGLYEKYISDLNPYIKVYAKACPLFAPLVEEGWTDNEVARLTAEIYLQELVDKDIDNLLLGCTHYPLLYDCIRRVVGNIGIINPAEITAERMKNMLEENDMLHSPQDEATHKFYVSYNTEKFTKTCSFVLGKEYPAQLADI